MNDQVRYEVKLPNGQVWVYTDKVKAENATLIARALAAMPFKGDKVNGKLGKYGQQSALARELGYFNGPNTNHPGTVNHTCVYSILSKGLLPRSAERRALLQEIASRVPENWYETMDEGEGKEAAGAEVAC